MALQSGPIFIRSNFTHIVQLGSRELLTLAEVHRSLFEVLSVRLVVLALHTVRLKILHNIETDGYRVQWLYKVVNCLHR